jgi:uridine kinase
MGSCYVIGITGGSGVGKTTLIKKIYQEFPNLVSTFSLDNYYLPKSAQLVDANGEINFDLPTALNTSDMERDFNLLLAGKTVKHRQYGFNHPEAEMGFITIEPRRILVVEGIFVMHYPFLRNRLDFSVFIEVNEAMQLARRLKRDMEERNYTSEQVIYQWEYHVKPAYEEFVLPHRGDADMIINNDTGFGENIQALLRVIHANVDHRENTGAHRTDNKGAGSDKVVK